MGQLNSVRIAPEILCNIIFPLMPKSPKQPKIRIFFFIKILPLFSIGRVNIKDGFQIMYLVTVIMNLCDWVIQLDVIPVPYVVNLSASRAFGRHTFTLKTDAVCFSEMFVSECKVSHCGRPQGQLCLTVSK